MEITSLGVRKQIRLRSAKTEGFHARIKGCFPEFFFDAEQLVVLRQPVTAASRSCFNLSGICGNGQICNEVVFCFTGTVARDGGIFVLVCQFDGFQRFRDRTNLVQFNEDGIGAGFVNPHLEAGRVCDKEIIAHQLAFMSEGIGQLFPPVPIVLIQSVFDGDNRILIDPIGPELNHLV